MNYYESDLSSGIVVGGEIFLGLNHKYSGVPKNGVTFVHGAGSVATYCLDALGNQNALTTRIIGGGFSGFASDNGGPETWGNDDSIAKLNTNINFAQTYNPRITNTKMGLVCASMGGIISLNYALAHPTKVACIVGVIPVINANDIVTGNRGGYGSALNAAYGGYDESSMGATHNPYTYRNSETLMGLPMLFYYGATDSLCLPEWTEAFAAADPTNRTLISVPSGHDFDTYGAVDPDVMFNFLKQHNI